jgi:YfiH family protein
MVGPSGWFASTALRVRGEPPGEAPFPVGGIAGVRSTVVQLQASTLDMERRTLRGGVTALVPVDMESGGFMVAFTERSGGASSGIFETLNLGLRSGDDPELVKVNRRRVCAALGIDEFACGKQVHGTRIEPIGRDRSGAGFLDPVDAMAATDGLITDEDGVALAILTADCVPIVLADPTIGRLAVVHAGWRGIAGGIVSEVLAAFDRPTEVRAAIGPAIGPDHYEVGEDVAMAVGKACPSGAVTRRVGSRVQLDLPASVAGILEDARVRRIVKAELCTACEKDRFFSYRRDGSTGRQGVVAVRMA